METTAVHIFQASSVADYAIAKTLFLEYQKELGVNLCFQSFEEELSQLPQMYGGKDGCLLLAKYDNDDAGCIAIRRKTAVTCEMKRLFVRPSYKNLGIGRQLVTEILEQARVLQYKHMVLDTLNTLIPALHLYQQFGFTQTAAYYNNPLEGVIYLEKYLD